MLFKDFLRINSDILVERVYPDELAQITEGQTLFLITVYGAGGVSPESRPTEERKIRDAKYILPIFSHKNELQYVHATSAGNARLNYLAPVNLEGPYASHALFRAVPLEPDDPRHNCGWQGWPEQPKGERE